MIGLWPPFLHIVSHIPLAALISLDTLRNALSTLGYPAVALFIMIESSGIPFPGETMLLLASFYAAVDQRLQIPLVIVCAALGAIIGDNLGYLIGRTGGYALVRRFGRYVFLKPEHLERAERFFNKHGNKTVFFGRFVAVLRAWAAFLAGVNRMRWPTFLTYNAAGGICWAIIYGCLGFYAGRVFHDNFSEVEKLASAISWTGAALIVIAIVAAYILFRWRRAHRARPEPEQKQPIAEEVQPVADSDIKPMASGQKEPTTEEPQQPEVVSNVESVAPDQKEPGSEEASRSETISSRDPQ